MANFHMNVSGHVQGVGFRYFTRMKATQLGIYGWVRNKPDGSVEIIAEGQREKLNQFIDDLYDGNRFSKVSHIEIVELEEDETLHSFKIVE